MELKKIHIESERLLLLPIEGKYANEIYKEFTHEVTKYMFPKPADNIEETFGFIHSALQGLEKGNNLQMVIVLKNTKEFIGCIGLHDIDTKEPEVGIWTKKSSHGNRYGFEAGTALIQWAFDHLEVDHLVYPVDKRNIASRRIPECNGGRIVKEYKKINSIGFELDEYEYWIYKESNLTIAST